jgi:hypothetical protein
MSRYLSFPLFHFEEAKKEFLLLHYTMKQKETGIALKKAIVPDLCPLPPSSAIDQFVGQ